MIMANNVGGEKSVIACSAHSAGAVLALFAPIKEETVPLLFVLVSLTTDSRQHR